MNISKSDCATQTYFTNGKMHDQVKHVRHCISASMPRSIPRNIPHSIPHGVPQNTPANTPHKTNKCYYFLWEINVVVKVYCKTTVGRACGLSSSSSAPLIPLVSSSLLCMSPRIGWLQLEINGVRGEAFFYFVGLHSTPRTFRIIIGTTTYGQLPRKQADTNSQKISVVKLLVLSWTPLRARFASSS